MSIFGKMKKSAKALSPVVASIILISVTVTVSVVVAAWMSQVSLGMMGNAERGSITNIYFNPGNAQMTVTISDSGTTNINFTAAYVNGQAITTINPALNSAGGGVGKGAMAVYILTYSWVSGTPYDVKFTTTRGNNIVTAVTAP